MAFSHYLGEKSHQTARNDTGDDQMDAHFKVTLTAFLIIVLGVQAGIALGYVGMGLLLGIIVGIPYAVTRMKDSLRGFILAALVLQIGLAFFVLGFGPSLVVLLTAFLAFAVATLPMHDLYGCTESESLIRHLRMVLGPKGYQMVQNGEIIIPEDGEPKDGPCYTLIGPGNAVTFICGAQETRISGPGTFWTAPWERMQRVYDLNPRQESLVYDDVLTHDMRSARVEIDVIYGIDISEAARRGDRPLNEREIRILRRIDDNVHEWEATTRSAIERGVRLAIGQKQLNELLSSGDFESLERHILSSANHKLRVWDIRLSIVIVRDIQPKMHLIDRESPQRQAV
jgi:hypothetical protein